MQKMILVGERPSPRWDGDPRHVLFGPRFLWLAQTIFWPHDVLNAAKSYLRTFERMNVLPTAGRSRWTRDDHQLARTTGIAICSMAISEQRDVVTLGRLARTYVVGRDDGDDWPSVTTLSGITKALHLPHPSGRCRWWNDSENVASARDFCRRFL